MVSSRFTNNTLPEIELFDNPATAKRKEGRPGMGRKEFMSNNIKEV